MIVRPGGLIVRKGCGNFVRRLREVNALGRAAPVGDGEINLTFMRLPCRMASDDAAGSRHWSMIAEDVSRFTRGIAFRESRD